MNLLNIYDDKITTTIDTYYYNNLIKLPQTNLQKLMLLKIQNYLKQLNQYIYYEFMLNIFKTKWKSMV